MAEFRNPIPTVDVFIRLPGDRFVLIRRKNPPHGWALPGGFVDEGERLDVAAVREAKEETGLEVTLEEQFFTYGAPGRDPRKHTLSTVFIASASGEPNGADDAEEARAFSLDEWPEPVFDHGTIVRDVIEYLRTGKRRSLEAGYDGQQTSPPAMPTGRSGA